MPAQPRVRPGAHQAVKEEFPGVQLLPLDLDPDTSYANVENRLQMLIMNQTAEAEHPQLVWNRHPKDPGRFAPSGAVLYISAGVGCIFRLRRGMPGAEVRPGYKEGSRSCERLPS